MKTLFSRFHYWISKQASKISSRFIWISLTILALAIIIIPWLGVWISGLSGLSKFWVDILSPVSIRNIPYDTTKASWYSSIAYSIGVIVISGVLIALITNYLRTMGDKYQAGTLDHYAWKKHVLFLGFDELMGGTLRAVCEEGGEIVVAVSGDVESVRSRIARLLDGTPNANVEVIKCNYTDKKDLARKACVANAVKLFIIGQPDDSTHDASNLKSLDTVAEIVGDNTEIAAYIYIRNRASLSLIQRQGFEGVNDRKLRKIVNPFNFYENMSANLLTGFDSGNPLMTLDYQNGRRNLVNCSEDTCAHFVILGMTEVGMALAREVLMVAHYPRRRVKITLVDENAREEMFFFKGRYKELFNYCKSSFWKLDWRDGKRPVECEPQNVFLEDVEFEFVEGSIAHPKLMKKIEEWGNGGNILTLAICTNDSPKNMATALYLPRVLLNGEDAITVWVYQQGDDSLKEFCGHNFYKSIHTFSPVEYGGIEMRGSLGIIWSEEVAKAYKKASMNRDAAIEWDEMTQYERWSSLYNVRSMYLKLRCLGYELRKENGKVVLVSLAEDENTRLKHLELSKEELDMLAETEHIRWIADTLTKGFRPPTPKELVDYQSGKISKKELREKKFVHVDLRNYSELDIATKQYDIDMTDALIAVINKHLRNNN